MSGLEIRPSFDADLTDAGAYLLSEASEQVLDRFLAAVGEAIESIVQWPNIGSAALAEEVAIEGLRTRRVAGFPHQIIYLTNGQDVAICRVIHGQRDLPNLLGDLA